MRISYSAFTADGAPDAALTGGITSCNNSEILVGNGSGAFQGAQVSWDFSTTTNFALPVLAGDFNGDGKMDVLIGSTLGLQGSFPIASPSTTGTSLHQISLA